MKLHEAALGEGGVLPDPLEARRTEALDRVLQAEVANNAAYASTVLENPGGRHADETVAERTNRIWTSYWKELDTVCTGSSESVGLWLDKKLRTERTEYMDRPDFSEADRKEEIEALHNFNLKTGVYSTAASALFKAIRESGIRKRPVRVLDLASGYGGFPSYLAEEFEGELSVTGSDIQAGYMDAACDRFVQPGLDLGFRVVDALTFEDVRPGEFDIMTIVQAVHHFPPDVLARVISGAAHLSPGGILAIDGVRSPWLSSAMFGGGLLFAWGGHFLHDAVVSSLKMYARPELELIGRAAVPAATVTTWSEPPAFNVLHVYRPPELSKRGPGRPRSSKHPRHNGG